MFICSSFTSMAATTLHCDEGSDILYGATYGIDEMVLSCHSEKDTYYVKMWGIGPGLAIYMSYKDAYVIHCPLMKENKIRGDYLGLKVGIGVHAGVTGAIMTNKRLGICILGGASLYQYGAGATIDGIKIE